VVKLGVLPPLVRTNDEKGIESKKKRRKVNIRVIYEEITI